MNPAYVMRRNGMGVASIVSHPGPTPRGFRQCMTGPIPFSPSVRVAPPFPRGAAQDAPGGAPQTGPIDVSRVLEGISFDMNSTDWEARETFAAILRRLGGTVTDGSGGVTMWGGRSGGGPLSLDVNDLNLPDDASQRTVRETLQTLIARVKAATACVAAALALSSSGVQWQDVNPTQDVATAVAETARADVDGTFVDAYGEDANVAVELGRNARAAVSADVPAGTVGRSVSVAIGAHADATVSDGSTKNQAIAIGWHAQAKASNAIAIGSGAQHPHETAETGDATVASASEAMAFGYGAKATAQRAVQLAKGVNSSSDTLQFRGWTVVGADGKIPEGRLPAATVPERLVRPGATSYVADGGTDKTLEPVFGGTTEIGIESSNGTYRAGNEVSVDPPLGSRNFDLVLPAPPQFVYRNGTDVEPGDNFGIDLSELPAGIVPVARCAPSCGYVAGAWVAITGATPVVVKVRQTSPTRLYCVVKPFDPETAFD